MVQNNRELRFALLGIVIIALIYLGVIGITQSVPAAGQFFGHALGVLGFLLMLMTEILYTLRKRSKTARWGKMSSWLQFHIFTGITGPFLVLLHTSWKFNGLAGVVLLLTITIVISGFVGRYLYTAIPRVVEGVVVNASGSGVNSIHSGRDWLPLWHSIHIPIGMALFTAAFIHIAGALYYSTFIH